MGFAMCSFWGLCGGEGGGGHVHNTLYSLRWQYYTTEILPCQQILAGHLLLIHNTRYVRQILLVLSSGYQLHGYKIL